MSVEVPVRIRALAEGAEMRPFFVLAARGCHLWRFCFAEVRICSSPANGVAEYIRWVMCAHASHSRIERIPQRSDSGIPHDGSRPGQE